MVDRQEPNPTRAIEIGTAAKKRMLDDARSSGFFDSRYSYPLTYEEVELRLGVYDYAVSTVLTFDGILNVTRPEPFQGKLSDVTSVSEIPIAEYQDFEPLVRTVIESAP